MTYDRERHPANHSMPKPATLHLMDLDRLSLSLKHGTNFMTCLLFITLKAHWLRCFTAASCFKTLQSTKNSPRRLVIKAHRPSGSCCKCHLHTFYTLDFRENVDPCVFPGAIPAASCSCCLRECAYIPGAYFMSFIQQQKHNSEKGKKKALLSLTGPYTSPATCIDCSWDTALRNIFNNFLQYFHHSRPPSFTHNSWSMLNSHLLLTVQAAHAE